VVLVLTVIAAAAARPRAQQSAAAFTAEDMLKVATASVLDLAEDGSRMSEHSAIMRADRIKTPLLTISGDQDPNVPGSQSREIYYALRRLGREVEWVRYTNGGHRPPNNARESIDFEGRILAWYDKHLKKNATPPSTQ
jgi:dipeptidyl aminopeptidase/acylaminoacyl peptidase